ncbi:MAG: hypothetical protein OHK0012_25300 [Synechococcales cyanobacterium]
MLRKINGDWFFETELALEELVWRELPSIFNLQPLKRQYAVEGEICDILAVSASKQLCIIELKKEEDRYIVQQLTRYFHAIRTHQPFADQVDYQRPIRLVAIAPDFHKHNFIDRRFSILDLEFIHFRIAEADEEFHLTFHGQKQWKYQVPLPNPERSSSQLLPPPPRLLLNRLMLFEAATKDKILSLREKLLSFDTRIKEEKGSNSLTYGRGKTKPCCSFKFLDQYIKLYLWLPLPASRRRFGRSSGVGRFLIQTDWDRVHELIYIPVGKQAISPDDQIPISTYLQEFPLPSDKVETLLVYALETCTRK